MIDSDRLGEKIAQTLLDHEDQIMIAVFSSHNGNIIFFNKGAEVLTGFTRDEIIGQSFEILYPSEEADIYRKIQKMILKTKKGKRKILNMRHKSGVNIPVEIKLNPVLNEEGNVEGFILIAGDRSIRDAIVRELERSEEKFRTLFERSDDALLLLDGSKFTDFNPAVLKMLGATREQVMSSQPWDLSPQYQPDGELSAEKALRMIHKAQTQGSHRFEWIHKRINGELFPVEVILTPVNYGDKSVLYTVWRDISKRKKAEERLKEAEEIFRIITENSADMIWIRDLNMNYTYLSPAVEKVLGYTVEQKFKQRIEEYIKQEDVELIYQTVQEQISLDKIPGVDPNRSLRFEVEELCKNGRWIWTESITSFIRDDVGHPIGILGITRDISAQKKLEDELREAKEKAEESDRLKSAFVANMSHEIRTPMNSILGFSELLTDESLSAENKNTYISIIQSSSNQLLSIISDIVDISKIEAHQIEIAHEEVNLDKLFTDLFEQYTLFIQSNKSESLLFARTCDKASCSKKILSDTNRLKQVIINLIDNAIKFTPEGEIHFGCRPGPAGYIEIFVRDTGIGIPKEKIDRIFERFYQNKTNKDVFTGTGLGLAICKSLVELMGGEMKVRSKINQGSEFSFTLPLVKSR